MLRTVTLVMIVTTSVCGSAWAAPDVLPMCDQSGLERLKDQATVGLVDKAALDQVAGLMAVSKSRKRIAFPAAGETQTVEIGQSMISHLNYTVYDGSLTLHSAVDFNGRPPTAPGKAFGKSKHEFRLHIEPGVYQASQGLSPYLHTVNYVVAGVRPIRPRDNKPYLNHVVGLVPDGPGQIRIIWGGGDTQWGTSGLKADYKVNQCGVWSEGDFRRELVYSGVSQGTATITYREFSSDLARPAFTQELRYDLKEGGEVGFRGARFEIIKASNTEITYRVIKPLE